MKTISGLKI